MSAKRRTPSHWFARTDESVYALVMIHDDGIGANASRAERAKVMGGVDRCFADGTNPIIKGFFTPEDPSARDPE